MVSGGCRDSAKGWWWEDGWVPNPAPEAGTGRCCYAATLPAQHRNVTPQLVCAGKLVLEIALAVTLVLHPPYWVDDRTLTVFGQSMETKNVKKNWLKDLL